MPVKAVLRQDVRKQAAIDKTALESLMSEDKDLMQDYINQTLNENK